MKEICHKGLAKLVGVYGSNPMNKKDLFELIEASIEPDVENRKNIEKNLHIIPKVIPILFDWLGKHTIGAKEMAVLNLRKAYNAHFKDDPSWISFLGWTMHYITDWGTPYHSPISVANPVIPKTIIGGIGMGLLGIIANRKHGSKKMLEGAAKWGLVGTAVSGGSSLINLYLEHKIFEEQCDEFWDRYESIIIREFASQKEILHLPRYFEEAIEKFEEKMNELRTICNETSPNWILSSGGKNFADYMVQIAEVMDFAIQIINYY